MNNLAVSVDETPQTMIREERFETSMLRGREIRELQKEVLERKWKCLRGRSLREEEVAAAAAAEQCKGTRKESIAESRSSLE